MEQQSDPIGIVIFGRMNSQRLPGKVLMPVLGRELLGRIVDRLKLVQVDLPIVIATTINECDDPIVRFAKREKIEVFRGSETDVLSRALECCDTYGFKKMFRVCGDRVFVPWELHNYFLEIESKTKWDLITNCKTRTFPFGMTTELIQVESLRSIRKSSEDPEDLEHVTRYMYNNSQLFSFVEVKSEESSWGDLNFSIDTLADLERCEMIIRELKGKPEEVLIREIVEI